MEADRLDGNPIITPDLDPRLDENVNGPSLNRAQSRFDEPLSEYYLYFADHGGECGPVVAERTRFIFCFQ